MNGRIDINGQSGELRWAVVQDHRRADGGKLRPVILVYRTGTYWHVMGLTTLPTYSDGAPRRAIPDHLAVGLDGPGFLWGSKLAQVHVSDVRSPIGWVDAGLAAAVIAEAHLHHEWSVPPVKAIAIAQAA